MNASSPFVRIQTSDPTLNRIQSQISSAFSAIAPGFDTVTPVTMNNYQVKSTDDFLTINTISPSFLGITTIQILLGDATQMGGFSFSFKKTDSSSNTLVFIPTSTTQKFGQPIAQSIEGAGSYSTSSALAFGTIFSDGSNWWLV